MRALYECLLLIHPPAFRRRFSAEMLCIFDEAAPSTGGFGLLCDGLASLFRQWILRAGLWKLAAAICGAGMQIMAGGLIWIAVSEPGHVRRAISDPIGVDHLVRLTVIAVGGVIILVMTVSLWLRRFAQRRTQSL